MSAKPSKSAPAHLAPATRKWFATVTSDYELEEHHVRLLTAACESWDRAVQAREAISKYGLTYESPQGPKARPEVRIERESKLLFEKLTRALGLDLASAEELQRPAGRIAGRGRR